MKAQGNEKIELKKVMSVWDATLFIICVIIGSGIFISPKGVLEQTGSTGMALVMWFVTGKFTEFLGCINNFCLFD